MASSTTADYLVGATIAEGAFGRVLYAIHKATKQDVAIKVITKHATTKHQTLLKNVLTEQQLLQRWSGDKIECIVPLLASFHDSECLYMVMECAKGGSLNDLVVGTAELDEASVAYYGLQILEAIEFIHSSKVIHADLKPDNILLTEGGRIRLADFGCAIDLKRMSSESNAASSIVGTVDYSSPEIIRGLVEQITISVDLWSFGCIIYAMWHKGESPFHSATDALATEKICSHADGDLSFGEIVPEKWWQLLTSLLRVKAEDRLGFIDFNESENKFATYDTVRSKWPILVDLSEKPSKLPGTPPWLIDASTGESAFRDGAEGWSAFLI